METAFYRAAVPDTYRVLGIQVGPLTVGQLTLLRKLGCSFVAGGRPTIPDLIMGVSVCCRTWRQNMAFLKMGLRFKVWMRVWGLRCWLAVLGGKSFAESALYFRAFLKENMTRPHLSTPVNSGAPHRVEVPEEAFVISWLMSSGIPFEQAMDTPWAAARWEYCVANAIERRCQILNESTAGELAELQIQPQEELDKLIKAHLRATGGAN